MSGRLFIVPTPIGNLEDITLRAINTLKEVDLILAEDTRTSSFLLKHLGISKPLKSYHQHNEHKILDELISQLNSGKNIALISDAGTPGISDPGFLLIREAVEKNISIILWLFTSKKRQANSFKIIRTRRKNIYRLRIPI